MPIHANKTMDPTDRVLRTINALTFLPGIAFLIATGVTRTRCYYCPVRPWAFVGIGPLVLSAVAGLFILLIRPTAGAGLTVMDLALACFHISVAIAGWTDGRQGEIGGLATAALLADFFVHAFFVLRFVYRRLHVSSLFAWMRPSCKECPHCRSEARAKQSIVQATGNKESYHRVPVRDDGYDEDVDGGPAYQDARPSTEDETARLA